MPAIRSRTDNWRRSLEQLCERSGSLEITLPGAEQFEKPATAAKAGSSSTANLIWRVRVLKLTDTEIVVEQPAALGQFIRINDGIQLIGIIVIGQNRWMFRTVNLGRTVIKGHSGRTITALRLSMPDHVERCQRRNFYRVGTIGLNLPGVECFPLLDPATAAMAEAANRVLINDLNDAAISGRAVELSQPPILPEVGPRFDASLMNVGGGGVGLLIDASDRTRLNSDRLFWLRVNLEPDIPSPLGVTARLKHTHIDSAQHTYAGMAFEFGFDPKHQAFIVDQLCRYAANLQRQQTA